MIQIAAVVALFTDLGEPELVAWIERGWVRPQDAPRDAAGDAAEDAAGGWMFQDIDVARVRLIHDLHRGMRVEEDTIPLVLSLLDQVYELRSRLRLVLRAIDAQPEAVRGTILAALDE
jgi:chaperone modulatory protein CbpM